MVWNAPHIHLMINHLPVFAPVLAIPLLLLALWKREEKGAFIGAALLLIVAALAAFVAVQTGERAQDLVQEQQGISMKALSEHEEWAEKTAIVFYIVSALSLVLGFFRYRSNGPTSSFWIGMLFAGALICSIMVGGAALKGGEIHHPEIRPPDSTIEEFFEKQ